MNISRRYSVAALAAAGLLWGTTVPLSKLALLWLGPGWLTAARFGLAAAVLLAVSRRRRPTGLRAVFTPRLLVSGAIGYGGSVVVQNAGISRTSVTHAALLIGAVPVLIAVIAALWHHTVARPVAWAGFLVSLGGVGLITAAGGGGGATLSGDGLVLVSLVISATFTVAQVRMLTGRDPVAVTAVQFLGAALAALAFTAITEGAPAAPSGPGPVLAVVALAACGTLLPFTLFAFGQSRVSAEVAGAFLNFEPLVGALAGVVLFGNPMGPVQVAGGAAIVAGIALSSLPLLGGRHAERGGRGDISVTPLGRVGGMEYRTLGRSGLRVSVLTMGTMTFGGSGPFKNVGSTDVDQAARQVDMCLDAGVNLIDTADVYSGGQAEEIVGEVLRGRRDQLLLATKVRMSMGDGPNDAGLSRHHVISGCEASLRRLGTDHIDLYQVHEWDGQTPLEETLQALDLLVSSGKVRYVGTSNYASWQLMKALGTADRLGLPSLVSQQIYYSLQGREAEYELIPLAVDQGLGVLVWSPLAGGLLSGKYRRNTQAPAGSRQLTDWGEPPVYDQEGLYDIIEVLVQIADARGVSAAQVALAYLLAKPAVTSLVIGARTDEQLADNLAAADLALSDTERAELDQISAPPLIYPYWHQAKTARDRLSAADLTLLGPHLT